MRKWILLPAACGCVLLLGACAPKPKPKPKRVIPKVHTYTQRGKVVNVKDLEFKKGKDIAADFDGDGRKDMAIIRRHAGGNEVMIYINKSVGRYFVAGQITRGEEGEIIGLAVKEGGEHVDLVLIVDAAGGKNQLLHFKNDGSSFREVAIPTAQIRKSGQEQEEE